MQIKLKLPILMRILLSMILVLFGALNSAIGKAESIQVAVAANLQFVFAELKAEFKNQTGHDLKAVFNSSGKFVNQIKNGAPFDVFMSADMDYPAALFQQGFSTTPPKVYAFGAIVLWSSKFKDLRDWQAIIRATKIQKIAIANPQTAPYGREALNALRHFKLDLYAAPRLVYAGSVSQVNQYVYSGLVDLGFTAKSVVLSAEMRGRGAWIELPKESYTPIAQGVIILKYGKENSAKVSQQFYDFLSTTKAKEILRRNGYEVP